MCGIVALFSRHEPVSPDALQKATQSLYHRGPDGQRHWISPDGHVGLGHARLSIMQDTLRGPVLASILFFDQKKIVALLDSLATMDESGQVANDQVLMLLVSACVLQERFSWRPEKPRKTVVKRERGDPAPRSRRRFLLRLADNAATPNCTWNDGLVRALFGVPAN